MLKYYQVLNFNRKDGIPRHRHGRELRQFQSEPLHKGNDFAKDVGVFKSCVDKRNIEINHLKIMRVLIRELIKSKPNDYHTLLSEKGF